MFRPEAHIKRLINNSSRVCLPPFDPDEFLKCLVRFLKIEQDWIPSKMGYSLYLRTTFMSMTVN